jgi:hypothetical protein
VVHENLGGKASAGGDPAGNSVIIEPQNGFYVVDFTASEETSRAGSTDFTVNVLSRGAAVNVTQGYSAKQQELDRLTNQLEAKAAASDGATRAELYNKLSYLRERKREFAQYYQNAVSASSNAPKTQYTWSASSRKCGWANLDTCGSWVSFNVYEVRRYLGDPVAEYNKIVSSLHVCLPPDCAEAARPVSR